MLSHRLYYLLKPYLPWRVRIGLRSILARRKRAAFESVWPVDLAARAAPEGWQGWPDAKKFAVVLTHDVEGPDGVSKVRQLAELEMELGFRSSFNFVPEGEYSVPPELRAWLTDNGFEVGIHDLNHDGKLFRSEGDFRQKAARINRYVQEWGAEGFRAGFMLRNLDWMHELATKYDSSTFDTDPFEPLSDGTGSIFPFWIPTPRKNSPRTLAADDSGKADYTRQLGGYVELPYTLPQDSTLFLLLRETTPDIWLNKAEWLAENGGMVLLNVHPDYVCFTGEATSRKTFPVAHYRKLLEHLKSRHGGHYWQPLAREVAKHTAQMIPRPLLVRPKRICMITHSPYESDNRVTRYAESLAARGDHVDVLALRRSPALAVEETLAGVNVFRLQERYSKSERSKLDFFLPWFRFMRVSARWLRRSHAQQPYDLVHVHNMPDFIVFAAWYPKLKGAKIILDIHDIVPELYASKFGKNQKRAVVSVLKFLERRSARFAHHIIVSNHLWVETFAARTGTQGRCSVFINNVDTHIFHPVPRTRNDGKTVMLFPGSMQWHQGLDIAIRAFARVTRELPHAEFHIYGDGNMKPELIALTAELGLNDRVRFFDSVGVKDVAQLMANADLGVVPKRADSFGNEAYSTKIMEFMSVHVPVVISRTKIDQYYFDDSVVRFFESGNVQELAAAIKEVLSQPELRRKMVDEAAKYVAKNCWDTRKVEYLALVDDLLASR